MAFSSCSSNYDKILNDDYTPTTEDPTQAAHIAELSGYSMQRSNEVFALFQSGDAYTINRSYKVFSLTARGVILTITDNDKQSFDITFDDKAHTVRVVETTRDDFGTTVSTLYHVYDASGAQLYSSEAAPGFPHMFGDYVIFEGAMYTIGDDGALIQKNDLPENLLLDSLYACNEDYIYTLSSSTIVVYDTEFNLVSSWTLPTGEYSDVKSFYILNNGDILVQAMIKLDIYTEKKYDIIDQYGRKYDQVNYLVRAKSGKDKELKLDFIISDIKSRYELDRDSEYENYYSDSFENIAITIPIIDRRLDYSDANVGISLMNNKGKIGRSLKIVDGQTDIPTNLGDGKYLVSTVYGRVVTNSNGKILSVINNDSLEIVGNCFVGSAGIYDLEMNKIYDLRANNATVEGTVNDVVFVKSVSGDNCTVTAIRNGQSETVETSAKKNISFTTYTATYTVKDNTGSYRLYNAQGDFLQALAHTATEECWSDEYNTGIFSTLGDTREFYVVY